MASQGPKRESLSRYFKDLDEFEDSDSDTETSKVDGTSNAKSSDKTVTKSNNVKNSAADNELACKPAGLKPDLETEKELPPHTTTSSNLSNSNRHTDVKANTEKKNKLPSASECLSTRSNPTFLKVSETKEINWDAREKRLGGGDEDTAAATNVTTNAVPPPSSYEPITDPGIKVVDSEGRKRKTVWSDLEDQNTSTKAYKVHKDDGDDEGDDGS
ncbi:unnamed protein product [Candidula unifasciata]|uniref:Uncharacterized protein n=1 Tax=Candidula unifasciata TaxID=100452 RepID=A0A8S3Z5T5_9EUPU|nr:unnamed protein product [Candidula unifasciata]